jgi:hypothetical protein
VPNTLSNAAANASSKAVTDLLDAGAGAGSLIIYDDSAGVPATVDADATGVVLATLPLSKPAFTTGTTGERVAASIGTEAASATGTAAYCRFTDSNGVAVIQGSVGVSGAALNIASVALQEGADVEVTAFTYTQPE